MNNLLSYCGLVNPRISASVKDLPVAFSGYLSFICLFEFSSGVTAEKLISIFFNYQVQLDFDTHFFKNLKLHKCGYCSTVCMYVLSLPVQASTPPGLHSLTHFEKLAV